LTKLYRERQNTHLTADTFSTPSFTLFEINKRAVTFPNSIFNNQVWRPNTIRIKKFENHNNKKKKTKAKAGLNFVKIKFASFL
jgi:hypothetical protein